MTMTPSTKYRTSRVGQAALRVTIGVWSPLALPVSGAEGFGLNLLALNLPGPRGPRRNARPPESHGHNGYRERDSQPRPASPEPRVSQNGGKRPAATGARA